jgi:hypothetical protein
MHVRLLRAILLLLLLLLARLTPLSAAAVRCCILFFFCSICVRLAGNRPRIGQLLQQLQIQPII